MEKIDKLDRQILGIISQNARVPFRDVAEQCDVSRAAIHQRVQRMIENEVITGSGYHINPKVLGFATSAYIEDDYFSDNDISYYQNKEKKSKPDKLESLLLVESFSPSKRPLRSFPKL